MAEHLLGQGEVQGHQEDGPVNGVEPDDVFADQVEIRRPVFLKQVRTLPVTVVADPGDVVGQRVQPYVDHVAGIKIHRNPPFEGGPGYAQILQARQQEVVHHLIFPGYRLDEFRMGVDMLDQPVRIFAHLEEIGLLPGRLHRAPAVGTFSVHQLGLGEEGLAGSAVHALIIPFVNVAFLIHFLEDLLHLALMVFVRGADEFIVGSVHQIPDLLDLPGHIVHEFLGRNACFLRFQLDLLAVLVGPGLEEHVKALASFIPGDGVRQHDLIGIADVGLAGRVGNGRCDIILWFFHLLILLLENKKSPILPSGMIREDGESPCYHFFSPAPHDTGLVR